MAGCSAELLDIYYSRLESQALDRSEDTYRAMATIQVGQASSDPRLRARVG